MIEHCYEFDQRVYLRRNTSQYGHIGMTADGSRVYDWQQCKIVQPVFWESPGADIHTWERADDLMGEEELQERRRLFLSLMRCPEMLLVRLALRSINWCAGLDWRDITEVEIDPPHDLKACWSLDTPEYFVHCLCPDARRLTYDDFTLWYRCTGESGCKCYFCTYPTSTMSEPEAIQDETARFSDGLFFHVENAEGERII